MYSEELTKRFRFREELEMAACLSLGKDTGTALIKLNQGGIQNRNISKEVKTRFKEALHAYMPGRADKLTGFKCNIAERSLISCKPLYDKFSGHIG